MRPDPPSAPAKDEKKKTTRVSTGPKLDASTYKTMTGSSQYRFGVLAKIVKHMKNRHCKGADKCNGGLDGYNY